MDNKTAGRQGEDMAARCLEKQGYRILARNWRRRWGEIDIIAQRQGVTYFVEVKTASRLGYAAPADKVNLAKREHIARAAAAWFAEQGRESDSALLVAEVELCSGRVQLIEDLLL